MAKRSIFTTTQLIADILSFKHNQEALSKLFKDTTIDWDAVVMVGSQHLMLPALYCKLKEKALLRLIPDDLHLYLKEIAAINSGRNRILLTEAHEISGIFKKENIEHVFIKGMALLAGNTFKDPAERMIGDIDILVAQHHLHAAFDILTKQGYDDTVSFSYEQKNYRHLSRQISKSKFGAIELHSEVLIHKYRHLIDSAQLLKTKQMSNGIAIPSIDNSIKIAILALQINDKVHYLGHINFKTIYDCMALNLHNNPVLQSALGNEKHAQSFLHLSSVLFNEITPDKGSSYSRYLKQYFIFCLQYPKAGRLVRSLLRAKLNTQERLQLLFNNKSYRTHILKHKLLNIKT